VFLLSLSALLADQCDSPNTLSQRPQRVAERLKKEQQAKRRSARKVREASR
jgi:hypothetical protein